MRTLLLATIALSLFGLGNSEPAAGGQITWEKSYESALELARKSDRPVFIAANTDDESRSELLAKSIYRDEDIARLSKLTVNLVASQSTHGAGDKCPRFGSIACADHKKVASRTTPAPFLANAKGFVASPQHVWLDPQGAVLLSIPWEVSKEELAWCFVAALRRLDPKCAVELPKGSHPPHRLLMKACYEPAPDDEHGRGLTPLESAAWVKAYKQSSKSFPASVLLTDEEPVLKIESLEFRTYLNEATDPKFAQHRIRLIGAVAPASYWKMLEPYAMHTNETIRHEIAVAFEQMGTPSALKAIGAALDKEKSLLVRGSWLRALGSCGFADKSVAQTLSVTARTDAQDSLRRSALIGLGYALPSADVRTLLFEKLSGDDHGDAVAAACAIAMTRDPAYALGLGKLCDTCTDPKLKESLTLALVVLNGENLSVLEESVAQVTQDAEKRNRVFFHPVGEKVEY
jgi:hypothetical protein